MSPLAFLTIVAGGVVAARIVGILASLPRERRPTYSNDERAQLEALDRLFAQQRGERRKGVDHG